MSSEDILKEEMKIEKAKVSLDEIPMSKRRKLAHRIAMVAFFSLFCFVIFLGFYWSNGAPEVTYYNCAYCDETSTDGEWFDFDDPQINKLALIMRIYGYTDHESGEYKFPTTRNGDDGKIQIYICEKCIEMNNLTVEG